ncbi:ABC transporter substrate-binding protein [uncultured Rothia sp.]|uniref:ABC transporter substrate-binding protein n=1 Tax=uncultured Rothia sp. TaxID=316088 RepID=UPI0025CD0488|nr:ABC transporter substrate-binding protein [uncultured Rothia sp.]
MNQKPHTFSRRTVLGAAGVLGVTGLLSACGLSGENVFSGDHEGIVVGSAAFAESQILAEIYAGALKKAGFDARTQLSIGAREAYLGALASGAVDVIPDYSGNLLLYLDPKATASTAEQILQALPAALGTLKAGGSRTEIRALKASAAEDKDSLVVTAQTSQKYGLRSLEDLASHCTDLKLGAAPEFAERAYGIPGLKEKYGCVPAEFVPLSDGGGALTVKALLDDTVQVIDLYSTTPAIEQNQLVVLEDPKNMILAQQVLPIINTSRVPESAVEVLNRVSEKLTTADLRVLNDRVAGTSKQEPAQAAAWWLGEWGF